MIVCLKTLWFSYRVSKDNSFIILVYTITGPMLHFTVVLTYSEEHSDCIYSGLGIRYIGNIENTRNSTLKCIYFTLKFIKIFVQCWSLPRSRHTEARNVEKNAKHMKWFEIKVINKRWKLTFLCFSTRSTRVFI